MSILFSSKIIRQLDTPGYSYKSLSRENLTGSMADSDNSWRNDPYLTGLRSTQQINLDWSDFSNHTFFNSAESKVNVAFERIINGYPFDGTKLEINDFINSLSGFEKYVFDLFPKFIGDIKFDKSSSQYMYSEDKSGYLFPEISRNILGERSVGKIASAGELTLEMWLYASSSTAYDNQTIFQKINTSNNHGVSLFVSKSLSGDSEIPIVFGISSGSIFISSSMNISKGEYTHIACTYNKDDINAIKLYKNSSLVSSSSAGEISLLDFLNKDFYIGSGSSHDLGITFEPKETLDINIDEMRFWKKERSQSLINEFYKRNIFQDNNLSFYYRFNEPTGSYDSNNIILDHSGNGLHGQVQNYLVGMRGTKEQSDLPIFYERTSNSPVLFPDQGDLLSLNLELLTSASLYDTNNPNLITRLVPNHYFLEGQSEEGLEGEFGNINDQYGYNDSAFPGNGKIPSSQILSSFLFIWASFFDEIKVYLDAFSKLRDLNYISKNSVPAQFLHSIGRRYGIELPNNFSNINLESYLDGKNLSNSSAYSSISLKDLQEILWRRLLKEMPSILRMKGTVQSVRSLMLSLGINPDTSFKIKEYGGKKNKKISNNRFNVNSYCNYIDFSTGSNPFLSSSHLTAYRHEPGEPWGAPTISQTIEDNMGANFTNFNFGTPSSVPNLTMLTSASWSWEASYILNTGSVSQSLFRIESSGSNVADTPPSICVNLIANNSTNNFANNSNIVLAFSGSSESNLIITGSGINIFDGDPWYININHIAEDNISNFLIRAYKANGSEIVNEHHFSGSYTKTSGTNNRLEDISFGKKNLICIGEKSSGYTNDLLNFSGDDTTSFTGKIAGFRFWSKSLSRKESIEHALNPFSVAVENPLINYNFFEYNGTPVSQISTLISDIKLPFNSWERLRLSSELYQEVSESNSTGELDLIDTSRNGSFKLSGFPSSINLFNPTRKIFSKLDPNYDSIVNVNKVRIRSMSDQQLAEDFGAENNNVYTLKDNIITDDRRFSIEASIVRALNEDIINIIANNDFINDAIGTPEQMFAVNYPSLEKLSDKYFNRLSDKIDIVEYFKFFKWFDDNFGHLIEKIIPRTTEFLGVNFVIESHMLERHRFEYKQADVHIDLNSRLAADVDYYLESKILNEGT